MRTVATIVLLLSLVGLAITGASWADAGHSSPLCGSSLMSPGEQCDDNGVETSYDDAVRQQQRARTNGPIGVAVSGLLGLGSLGVLIALRRRTTRATRT